METFVGTLREANERLILTIPKVIVVVAGFKNEDMVRVTIEKAELTPESKENAIKSDYHLFGDRFKE